MNGEIANFESRMDDVLSVFNGTENELIPVLQGIQNEFGYIPRESMTSAARFLNIAVSAVYGVVTFYAQFYLTPQGKHKVRVCLGTACHVRGSGDILKAVQEKLGIEPGQSTDDFEFNLERVACVGSCALAPVVVIDDRVYGAMTPERTLEVIDEIYETVEPAPA